MPQRITSESSNTKKRREIYLNGGILFVPERILVVDLLSERVPIDLVTGLIVYNDCLMSFILRLYRIKNKKGFIKALSQSPHAFFGDLCLQHHFTYGPAFMHQSKLRMNAVPTITDLINLKREELEELVGKLLYDTLHESLAKMASDAIAREKDAKKTSLFECSKRKKGFI